MKKGLCFMVLILSLLLTGCVDKKQIAELNAVIEAKASQVLSLEKEKVSLQQELDDQKSVLVKVEEEKQLLKDLLQSQQTEKDVLTQQVETLEGELNIQNEAALLVIQEKNTYYEKILALKATASLKTLVTAYKMPLEDNAAAHYGNCLYEATKREGATVLIALLEKSPFDVVDGVIGHFATALGKTADLNYKTQLMVDASSLNGTQSPTTLYFYARVLYFLNKG